MKYTAISVESQDEFKDSILDVIEWTPHTLAAALKAAVHESEVDEGVLNSIWCFSELFEGHPVSFCEFDVTSMAEREWQKRIAKCVALLRKQKWFHVEHTWVEDQYRDLRKHKIWVAYEPGRSI